METNLATQQDARDLKQEIRDLKQHTEYGFRELKQELNNKILEVNSKMIQSEQRTIIKLGTIISLAIGVAVTLTKLVA